ncbi:unnamed protein product [Symbiodinium microadriaticum]|nr:unnamed protein product [Symbiodinium microadriaticum]
MADQDQAGDQEVLDQVYAKLRQARVPGKVARSLVVMWRRGYQDQLKDVDREEGILNFLEYLMYKIENDMDLEPERMTEAARVMKIQESRYIQFLLGDPLGFQGQVPDGPGEKMTRRLLSDGPLPGRGGERNFAKPDVDQEHLLDVLKKYVKHAGVGASFNFEPYGTLSKSSAVQAKGLSKASGLIQRLQEVESTLNFKYNPLKDCLRLVIKDYPDLKHQVPFAKQDAWPGDTAEMLLTVMAHARRLCNDTRFKEACSKATQFEIQDLEAIRSQLLEAGVGSTTSSPARSQQPPGPARSQQPPGPGVLKTPAAARSSTKRPAPPVMEGPARSPLKKIRTKDLELPDTPKSLRTDLSKEAEGRGEVLKKPAAATKKVNDKKQKKAAAKEKPELTEAERGRLQIMHYHDSVALRVQVAKMKAKLAQGGSLAEALKEKAVQEETFLTWARAPKPLAASKVATWRENFRVLYGQYKDNEATTFGKWQSDVVEYLKGKYQMDMGTEESIRQYINRIYDQNQVTEDFDGWLEVQLDAMVLSRLDLQHFQGSSGSQAGQAGDQVAFERMVRNELLDLMELRLNALKDIRKKDLEEAMNQDLLKQQENVEFQIEAFQAQQASSAELSDEEFEAKLSQEVEERRTKRKTAKQNQLDLEVQEKRLTLDEQIAKAKEAIQVNYSQDLDLYDKELTAQVEAQMSMDVRGAVEAFSFVWEKERGDGSHVEIRLDNGGQNQVGYGGKGGQNQGDNGGKGGDYIGDSDVDFIHRFDYSVRRAEGASSINAVITEDVLAWVPPLERPIESSETPGNQVADTSGIQVADPTLAAPDASPNPGPMSNAEPNPEYLVYLDVSSWTPSDLALYPAICAITFRYLPEVKDALEVLQAVNAGPSMAALRWGGYYSTLHDEYHDPSLQELSGGNFLLSLTGVFMEPSMFKAFQSEATFSVFVEAWLVTRRRSFQEKVTQAQVQAQALADRAASSSDPMAPVPRDAPDFTPPPGFQVEDQEVLDLQYEQFLRLRARLDWKEGYDQCMEVLEEVAGHHPAKERVIRCSGQIQDV